MAHRLVLGRKGGKESKFLVINKCEEMLTNVNKQAGAELCQAQATLDLPGFELIFWILQVWFSLKDLV